ncbi:RNA polymerase II subunit A C-terminal domain phosphatase [Penicillium canariense]|uniref:RNA polymerase II subunit A C-terminal domain phosphatase n=1 Tax=Penicillium canariense TaxID=189055 RepID=A0A9W9I8S2_9EURO|nr:RNA polymerase II subunit A C-terminal domain phosphatase [Penicillium canariense]KAJ5167947.1 RNA polymerase II subunit A C-terminal domain phosphatase [Penicillium canariense]
MHLRLPLSLHYPITVTSLLKQEGDTVERDEALFWYIYQTTVEEGDGLGNQVFVKRKFPTRFESTVDGTIVKWNIAKGDIIDEPVDVVEVEEPCAHEVQFGGMCAECGKDMTEATYNTEISETSRAPIYMTHDNTTLTVSEKEATRVEEDAKRRLLASRRLSLVVDLDQTIIHATVDPTVGEWKEDKDNPNYEALKGVRSFQLVDDTPGARGCWYYIKLRPGLEEFLERVADLFELHIYTMGTRAYAQNIADLIDPTRKLFGDRILSRDESGSLTAKNLQRLFPVDTKMVVIIDDRGDVWRWIPNLIKVVPYDFFVGIGDINSSFLPKKQDIAASRKAIKGSSEKENEAKEHHVNGSTMKTNEPETGVSALEQLVTMGGGDDPRLLQEQTNAQEETIMHQVEDRPLLQKQKELDADDDASADGSESSFSADDSQETAKPRHHLLEDNDTELFRLQERLEDLHKLFFDEYDKRRTNLGGRVAALRGEKAASKDKDVDLKLVPDIKDIVPLYKRSVLGGVVVVFSGVIPLGQDLQNAEVSLWAKSFGVTVMSKIDKHVTHLVAGRNRTAKVRDATRWPNIKIVTAQWLYDSVINWSHMDEEPYLLPVHPDDRCEPISPGSHELAESAWISSSDEGTGSAWTDDEANEMMFKDAGLNKASPLGYDEDEQAAVHDELKDFLGSDDDSESDSDYFADESAQPSKKRKRGDGNDSPTDEEATDDDGDESDPKGSRLSQRIKRSYERSTGLREVATAGASETDESRSEKALPTAPIGEEDREGDAGKGDTTAVGEEEGRSEVSDEEDGFEKEMMAAFEDPEYTEKSEDESMTVEENQ